MDEVSTIRNKVYINLHFVILISAVVGFFNQHSLCLQVVQMLEGRMLTEQQNKLSSKFEV